MKIGKEDCVSVFRRAEKKEERKKETKKKKKRVGRRAVFRRTRVDHPLERSSSEASTRVASKPGQTATRAEATGSARTGQPATTQKRARVAGARAANDWRLPVLVTTHSQRAWDGQFGPVAFCLPDFCPGSSSNTIFT